MRRHDLLCAAIVLLSACVEAQTLNGFALEGALVPANEIRHDGSPRDGIPAIDRPQFVSAKEAKTMYTPDGRAIVVHSAGAARVYPIAVLNWHKIVNGRIGKTLIAITYCPLCGTGVAFRRKVGDQVVTLGASGLLYQSDVLLYDRATGSLWSQLMRKCVVGPHKEKKLQVYPSTTKILDGVLRSQPKARVLSTKTRFRRDYKRAPYAGYEEGRGLFFPVKRRDDRLHPKAWCLLMTKGKQSTIVAVESLNPKKRPLMMARTSSSTTKSQNA